MATMTTLEWSHRPQSTTGRSGGRTQQPKVISRTIPRTNAYGSGPTTNMGEIVESLRELKSDLRSKKRGSSQRSTQSRNQTPTNYTTDASNVQTQLAQTTQPISHQLLNTYIAHQQSALEQSKLELERSLAATREMEAAFEGQRRRLAADEQRDRDRQRQNQEYWNPYVAATEVKTMPSTSHTTPTVATNNNYYRHHEESKENTPLPAASSLPTEPWHRSGDAALISQTPRSHHTTHSQRMIRQNRPAGMTSDEKAKSKHVDTIPAGRRMPSNHPNHKPPPDRPVPTEDVDIRSVLRALPATKKTVLDLFRNFDVHCTGAVNSNEFAAGLIQAGVDMSPPQVAGLISKLDRENRGEIRYINLIETAEDTFRVGGRQSEEELVARLNEPALGPQSPSHYVPVPPFDVVNPAVDEARRIRNHQSHSLAILRSQDMAVRRPDGSFQRTSQMPDSYHQLHDNSNASLSSSINYFPRPIGFVEKPYSYSLGPSNIVENHLVEQSDLRASNSIGWGGNRDGYTLPSPLPGEFDRNYHESVLDPTSSVGASLRTISERVSHEPIRFTAMMRKMDRDGDERVSHKEFVHGLEQLGVNVPTWRLKNLLKSLDRHGTGSVKYDEVSGLLAHYAEAGKREQAEHQAIKDAPTSQVNPHAPGFKPSLMIPLHGAPTWSPSSGLGNNVDEFTKARRIEVEWAERQDREEQERQQQQQQQEYEERQYQQQQQQQQPTQSYSEEPEHHRPMIEEVGYHEPSSTRPQYESAPYVDEPPSVEPSGSVTPAVVQPTVQSPPKAKYPYLFRTSEENERLEAKQRGLAATSTPAPQPAPYEMRLDHDPQSSQQGTELPVLPVEYPQLKLQPKQRSQTPAPRRARSRSNSITSVRSQTPSIRSRAGSIQDLDSSFRVSSRPGSRRGSFSQASRSGRGTAAGEIQGNLSSFFYDNDHGKYVRLHSQVRNQSDASAYWPDDRSDRGRSRTRADGGDDTPRRSSSLAATTSHGDPPRSTMPVEAYGSASDNELFKILRLALPPPLSKKARAASVGRSTSSHPIVTVPDSATPSSQHSPQSQADFPVHHAHQDSSVPATPTQQQHYGRDRDRDTRPTHSRSSSVSSQSSAPIHRERSIGVAYESRGVASHGYGLSYGAWSDRRARDFYGSGWTLG